MAGGATPVVNFRGLRGTLGTASSPARQGDWKLVARRGSSPQLFNLSRDIGEQTDLAAKEPERLKELQAAYEKWNAGNIPAKWRRSERDSDGGRRRYRSRPAEPSPRDDEDDD